MSPEKILPCWGVSIEPFSSTKSNIHNNQPKIYSNSPTDITPSPTEENCEKKSDFEIPSSDTDALSLETDLEMEPADVKKERLLDLIRNLKTMELFSDLQYERRIIETVAMSPKISDLSKYYVRYYDDNTKTKDIDTEESIRYTELSLESLQEYLQTLYPEETILSVKSYFSGPFLEGLKKTEEGKPAYILYQFPRSEYKMLLVFQLKEKKFNLRVLNSIGVTTLQKSKYWPFINYIHEAFFIYFNNQLKYWDNYVNYRDSYEIRQDDESNCSAIIIDDMRIARELIANGESFERYQEGPLNNEFLKICKPLVKHDHPNCFDINIWTYINRKERNGYIGEKYLPMSILDINPLNPNPVLVNTKATFLSLDLLAYYIRNKAEFTSPSKQKIKISDIAKRV